MALVFIPTYLALMGETTDPAEELFERELAGAAAAEGFGFVSLTPRFRRAIDDGASIEDFYFLRDGHCKPAGYDAVAGAARDAMGS